jgi:hypothetical protein
MLLAEAEASVITKSIRLTEAEAEEIAGAVRVMGGTEAGLLKEATLRGLRDIRVSRGVWAYLEGASVEEAAAVAGLPRVLLLEALVERGVSLLRDPANVQGELEALRAAEAAANDR